MSNRKWDVGHITDIDLLGSRIVNVDNTEIALFRLSDGEVCAMENKCPHKKGKLSEGMVCGRLVHCPLHDWRIDLDSGLALTPDEGRVNRYKLEVDQASGQMQLTTVEPYSTDIN